MQNIPQEPQKQSSLKSFKIQNPPPIPGLSLLHPSEMAFFAKSKWQNRKERPNRSTNNGDMDKIAKLPVSDLVSK